MCNGRKKYFSGVFILFGGVLAWYGAFVVNKQRYIPHYYY